MVKVEESLQSMVNETESTIQESKEKIRQALEIESNKMREKAEREANQIIAKAKDEAEQILRKSREEAAAIQQKSAKVINETREKASQIITEFIAHGPTQGQREISRAAFEARSKISLQLTQVSKNIEQIDSEIDTSIKAELERLTTVIAETNKKLQSLSELNNKEAEVLLGRPTSEAVAPTVPVVEKTDPVAPSIGDKQDSQIKESDDPQLFKGNIKMEVYALHSQERLEGVPDWLARIPHLKVLTTEMSQRGKQWVTTYNISLEKPLPLLKIFKTIPQIKDVVEHKGSFVTALR